MNIELTFKRRVLAERQRLGLTQQEVADAACLPVTHISHFERGRRMPSSKNLARIAIALGVSTDYLLGLTDKR